mmetsp:Transcript_12167/g.36954  ORF Transcript_12167/g.36954 Transcript_12167/m.36954 type:complete len:287 (+) Transcript_12167:639-1499(+)
MPLPVLLELVLGVLLGVPPLLVRGLRERLGGIRTPELGGSLRLGPVGGLPISNLVLRSRAVHVLVVELLHDGRDDLEVLGPRHLSLGLAGHRQQLLGDDRVQPSVGGPVAGLVPRPQREHRLELRHALHNLRVGAAGVLADVGRDQIGELPHHRVLVDLHVLLTLLSAAAVIVVVVVLAQQVVRDVDEDLEDGLHVHGLDPARQLEDSRLQQRLDRLLGVLHARGVLTRDPGSGLQNLGNAPALAGHLHHAGVNQQRSDCLHRVLPHGLHPASDVGDLKGDLLAVG